MPSEQTPTYNLKVVLKETGLKADTLRAWERRYGLPKPQRSKGRHRLYSRRDIETIKWLHARQKDGYSISNAVDLWRSIEAEGSDPLLMTGLSPSIAAALPEPVSGGRGLGELTALWVSSCIAFDEEGSGRILSEAFALYPVEEVCLQLIMGGLRRIGDGWYEGQITVEQEHFASEIARRQLEALISAAPAPTRSEKIFIGAAPDEQHDLMLLMITVLLRRRGWRLVYLGANVPLESYGALLDAARCDLLILSAQQLHTAGNLREVAMLALNAGIPLAYGGRIFREIPELREQIPGAYLGERLEAIPAIVTQVLSTPLPKSPRSAPDETSHKALANFQEQRPYIEAAVRRALNDVLPPGSLETALSSVSRDLEAALLFGDLNYALLEFNWISDLLKNRGLPSDLLAVYLNAYLQAAEDLLNDDGRPLVDWLQQLELLQ